MSSGSVVHRLRPWLPAVAYMALIWILSSMSQPPSIHGFPFKDKGVHFVEYGVLSVFLSHALTSQERRSPLRVALLAVGSTALWGLLDEIHQAYVPGRFSDAWDFVADTLGAVIGASAFALWHHIRYRATRA